MTALHHSVVPKRMSTKRVAALGHWAGTSRVIASLVGGGLLSLSAQAESVRIEMPQNTGSQERRLDDAEGEFEIGPLNGDARLKLTGKVKLLRVSSIGGAAMLDASELDAREVIVSGSLGGGSRLRLHAPSGKVSIVGEIGGGAAVEVNAPMGAVAIGAEQGGGVTGGARLTVIARDFDLHGGGTGGAQIKLTVSSGGRVGFDRLDGGARFSWRKATEGDPAPRIVAGELLGGGRFGEAGMELQRAHVDAPPREERRERRDREIPQVAPPALSVQRDVGRDAPGIAATPVIPAGIIDVHGVRIAAQIVSVDDSEISFRREGGVRGGMPETMRRTEVAAVLLSPVAESKKDLLLDHDVPGVLLRTGDFVGGGLKKFEHGRLTVSSVVFGLQSFDTGREAVAIFFRRSVDEVAK